MNNKRLFLFKTDRARRVLILILIGIIFSIYFWLASRYPDLNEKALMAKSNSVSDLVSMWPIFEIKANYSYLQKVFYSTINWINENKKGMGAGVFLGSIFLTLFSYLSIPGSSNPFLNSLYGFLMGSPIGVCVNCAAPIFKGVLRSKRVEMAFSLMLSSPTINIIVLTMVFSLFPLYMGIVKVLFTFLVVLVFVPVISKALGKDHKLNDLNKINDEGELSFSLAPTSFDENNYSKKTKGSFYLSWKKSFSSLGKDLFKNLRFIIRQTVPLMFMAGALGSALSHALPTENLFQEVSFLGVLILTLSAVLLPVPIAFDVILTNALFTSGLPPHLALVLLCTLGIFSLYSFFIIWQSASKQWALLLLFVIFVLGGVVGLSSQNFHKWFYLNSNIEQYHALKIDPAFSEITETVIDRFSEENIDFSNYKKQEPLKFKKIEELSEVNIFQSPFLKSNLLVDKSKVDQFTKKEGFEIGLTQGFRYGIRDYPDPFWIGRGTASGDIDKDGWDDVVLAANTGFFLYQNQGGWFKTIPIKNTFLKKIRVYAVALVDINNDGWLDLFFTTYANGNYLILNKNGVLQDSNPIKVPNNNAVITVSPSFADLDNNGYLDILNGNMALGIITGFFNYSPRRKNSLIYSYQDLNFKEKLLEGLSGETMSSLISDLNGDQYPDIYMSNDFIVPDKVLLGNSVGNFKEVRKEDNLIKVTPFFSMSVDSGDINNDGKLDLITTGTLEVKKSIGKDIIDGRTPYQYTKAMWHKEQCLEIKNSIVRKNCLIIRETDHLVPFDHRENLNVESCKKLDSPLARQDCLLSTMWMIVTSQSSKLDCEKSFKHDPLIFGICQLMKDRKKPYKRKDFTKDLLQTDDSFIYLSRGQGIFKDMNSIDSPRRYTFPGGWTWNTRLIDLDNDGWLDIFGAEGTVRATGYGWNIFLKNNNGQSFEQKQFSSNLTDSFSLFSYTSIDFDNDGDLDLIGNSSTGPIQIYENHAALKNNSIAISLRDYRGNRFGVGAKIHIFYKEKKNKGENKNKVSRQVRELKASGGYMSFNPLTVYFGLSTTKFVDKIEVHWRDGKVTTINKQIPSGFHYKIERK